jgi:hypothetical protein
LFSFLGRGGGEQTFFCNDLRKEYSVTDAFFFLFSFFFLNYKFGKTKRKILAFEEILSLFNCPQKSITEKKWDRFLKSVSNHHLLTSKNKKKKKLKREKK